MVSDTKSWKQEKSENKVFNYPPCLCNDIMLSRCLFSSSFFLCTAKCIRKVSYLCDLLHFYCIAFAFMHYMRIFLSLFSFLSFSPHNGNENFHFYSVFISFLCYNILIGSAPRGIFSVFTCTWHSFYHGSESYHLQCLFFSKIANTRVFNQQIKYHWEKITQPNMRNISSFHHCVNNKHIFLRLLFCKQFLFLFKSHKKNKRNSY